MSKSNEVERKNVGIFGKITKKYAIMSIYSRVAQWWSKKLLTSRLPVRARPREPRDFRVPSGIFCWMG